MKQALPRPRGAILRVTLVPTPGAQPPVWTRPYGRRTARAPVDEGPVWLTQKDAAARYGVTCHLLREAVRWHVLSTGHGATRQHRFDSATLDAFFRVHTVAALRALLRRARRVAHKPRPAATD